jgi:4-hydroxythreonine-4-phosphate dehydrogenase
VNKEAMRLVDPRFSGHTEYLARMSGTKQYAMMFEARGLRVTLVTIHVPLARVSACLRREDIEAKIRLTHDFLRRFHHIRRPRLAVTALNPHGREFGREEDEKIAPAIRRARQLGIQAEGPFPGDAIFYEAYHGAYDAVIAMYHDQGLGPLKTVGFDHAVNVTLGLPFVRTSPDHGTAFDIAYRNQARENSMLEALKLAIRLSRRG